MRERAIELAIVFALCATATIAQAQVYKCTDASGKTTYSDTPCASPSKPLNLPDPARHSTADPNMCAQLLDELNRLAAEADRSARRGRKESGYGANRRKALTRQYEARCVGIARSSPKPK